MDLKILRLLEKDARTSTAELARAVGLSAPSVAERIRKLQKNGVIEAYTVRINPDALGLKLSAWLRIRPVPGQLSVVGISFASCRRSRNATGSPARTASSRWHMSAR